MYRDNVNIIAGVQELKVLQPFCADYRASFHVRQIAALLGMNHATAALALKNLEKKNVLRSMREGRNKKYSLNLDNFLAKNYIENTESVRTAIFFERHFIIKKMLSEFVPSIFRETPVILFGSYAKESFTRESDIDILLIKSDGEKNTVKLLEEFGARHNKKIQIQKMTQEIFKKGLMEKDPLVSEIVKNHIILNNTAVFVDILWRYYNVVR
ncbi:MAG: nucleotidyltransferase domain-containing protein [Candidatus Aenigmarchaeota archaeon]|nr:nucleotidyltransferase domain-containing protein [Candidatus Aenigmarchaeota archaeon]MDI6722072.1 nucleotidyltransferase domain-containing protein [Candidatus Aenigmarchaeota archaeon]